MKRVLLMVVLITVMVYGCSGNGGSSIETTSTPWIHSSDFDQNQNLHAKASQTVLLPIDDKHNKTKSTKTVHTIRYYIQEDSYLNFTLDTNKPCIEEIKVSDSLGQQVASINITNKTSKVFLKQGSYTFTVKEITPMPEHCSISFMHHNQSKQIASKDDVKRLKNNSPSEFMSNYLFSDDIYRLFGQISSDGSQYLITIPDMFNPDYSTPNSNNTYNYKLDGSRRFGPLSALIQTPISPICSSSTCTPWDTRLMLNVFYKPEFDGWSGSWVIQGQGGYFGCALTRDLINPPEKTPCTPWGDGIDKAYLCGIDTVTQQSSPYKNKQVILTFINQSLVYNCPNCYLGCYTADDSSNSGFRFNLDYWDATVKNPRDLAFGIYNSLCPLSQGNCNFTFTSSMNSNYARYAVTPNTTSLLGAVSNASPVSTGYDKIRLTELLRYHLIASKLTDGKGNWYLNDGEVAILDNFGGALVLNVDTKYELLPLKYDQFRSITGVVVGNNAAVVSFADGTMIGQTNLSVSNMNLKLNGPSGNLAVKVYRAIDIMFSNDCPYCNLSNVQITNGWFGSRNFSGSYFKNAFIRNSVFDRANLTKTDFSAAAMVFNSFVKADLRDAILQGANFSFSNFDSANLCRAKLNQVPGTALAITLDGSYMKDANLAYTDLTGASMKNISFHGWYEISDVNTCIPDDSCGFTNYCATAYKATLNGTNLQGAFLKYLSLSNATIKKSDFSNAFLFDTDFTNTVFSTDASNILTNFGGAYLYGADFTSATVKGVKFQNSYFDTPGQSFGTRQIILYLSSAYTVFMGSQYTNHPVCPEFPISNTTVIPTNTDNTVICPNGNYGPCKTSDWSVSPTPDTSLIYINTTVPYYSPSRCVGTMNNPNW
ncbi:MAG: pentapeptide repeat-containing protein [Thermodesulfovibrionales bacterium]|nr:pentapeptide repeat-containing protein [Thermodesulfovibrionales bacterium]